MRKETHRNNSPSLLGDSAPAGGASRTTMARGPPRAQRQRSDAACQASCRYTSAAVLSSAPARPRQTTRPGSRPPQRLRARRRQAPVLLWRRPSAGPKSRPPHQQLGALGAGKRPQRPTRTDRSRRAERAVAASRADRRQSAARRRATPRAGWRRAARRPSDVAAVHVAREYLTTRSAGR
jgi:hypothetical protein